MAPASFALRGRDVVLLAMFRTVAEPLYVCLRMALRSFLLNDCSTGAPQGLSMCLKAFINCHKQVYVFDDTGLKFTCLRPYVQPY